MGFYLIVDELLVRHLDRSRLLVMESMLASLPLLIPDLLHVCRLPVHTFLRPSAALTPHLSNHGVVLTASRYPHHFDALTVGVPCFLPRIDGPLAGLLLRRGSQLQRRISRTDLMLRCRPISNALWDGRVFLPGIVFRWFGVYFGGFRHVEEFGVAGGLLVFLGFLAGEGAVVGAGEGSFLLLGVGFGLAA